MEKSGACARGHDIGGSEVNNVLQCKLYSMFGHVDSTHCRNTIEASAIEEIVARRCRGVSRDVSVNSS